jgi:hypothetical protein
MPDETPESPGIEVIDLGQGRRIPNEFAEYVKELSDKILSSSQVASFRDYVVPLTPLPDAEKYGRPLLGELIPMKVIHFPPEMLPEWMRRAQDILDTPSLLYPLIPQSIDSLLSETTYSSKEINFWGLLKGRRKPLVIVRRKDGRRMLVRRRT